MLMISLVSLFVFGCGSSNDDFVVTGSNPNTNPGTLTFNFVRAQQGPQEVPQSTSSIQFDWLDANNAIIETDVEPFASTITLVPPVGTASVRVTALTADGFPLGSLTGAVSRPADGQNQIVNLGSFNNVAVTLQGITVTPATVNLNLGTQNPSQQLTVTGSFSNGQNVPFSASALADVDFSSTGTGFTVSSTGLVSATAVGSGTVTASYTFVAGGQTVAVSGSANVNVTSGVASSLTISPDALSVGVGTTSEPVSVAFSPASGAPAVVPNEDVVFSISENTAGFTANPDGTVTVADSVAVGTSVTLNASYTVGGATVTDAVTVTASNARVFGHPVGTSLTLPTYSSYRLAVEFNGQQIENLFAAGYTVAIANTNVANVTGNGVIETGDFLGNTTVTLSYQGAVVDQFTLVVTNLTVTGLQVSPSELRLTPGEVQPYSVTATYSNNVTTDLSGLAFIDVNQVDGSNWLDTEFQSGRAIGGASFGNATYSFTIGAASSNVSVTQAAGFIESYEVRSGGLLSGLVPQGLTVAVDVWATMSSGEIVRLRPNQFWLSRVTDTDLFEENCSGNLLYPYYSSVGAQETWAVNLDSDEFEVEGNATREFTLRVVDSQSGTAQAAFTNYSDDPVLFEDIARPITVTYSNSAVQGFQVTDNDASSSSAASATSIATRSDIWGYPVLRAWNYGYQGNLTLEVQRWSDSDQVITTASLLVDVWHAVTQPSFNPSSIVINAGERREAQVEVRAARSESSEQRTFVRTLDFLYSDDNGCGSQVAMAILRSSLEIVGRRPGNTEIRVYDVTDDDSYGTLNVTVNGASNLN